MCCAVLTFLSVNPKIAAFFNRLLFTSCSNGATWKADQSGNNSSSSLPKWMHEALEKGVLVA